MRKVRSYEFTFSVKLFQDKTLYLTNKITVLRQSPKKQQKSSCTSIWETLRSVSINKYCLNFKSAYSNRIELFTRIKNVIYKVSKNNITILDPADGRLHEKSNAEFQKIWSGVLVLLLPNEGFVAGDKKSRKAKRFWQLIKPHSGIMVQAFLVL